MLVPRRVIIAIKAPWFFCPSTLQNCFLFPSQSPTKILCVFVNNNIRWSVLTFLPKFPPSISPASVPVPFRELRYPTLVKGNSSSKVPLGRDMLVPRVVPPVLRKSIFTRTKGRADHGARFLALWPGCCVAELYLLGIGKWRWTASPWFFDVVAPFWLLFWRAFHICVYIRLMTFTIILTKNNRLYVYICLSIYLSICLSIYLSVYLSIYLSIYLV